MAQNLNDFFVTKITTIRDTLASLEEVTTEMSCPAIDSLLSPSATILDTFKQATVMEIITIIKKASKASCLLDPIPTVLLNEIIPQIAPSITHLVNACLSTGVFPSDMKTAVVQPLLKKSTLDKEVLKNYRPVSNLSFVSKIIEKVIASRLIEHMKENDLLDPMQSAYRKGHSTETALLRVHNDIVSAIDKGHGVFLVLLDLSTAFDTVDHDILLSFLNTHVGLRGNVLNLFRSYLSGRTQRVLVDGVLSELCELHYGVPQGSVLGPIEFCTYTLPLGAILRYHKLSYHIYADDTQIYCSFNIKEPQVDLDTIISCALHWSIKHPTI